MAYTREITIDGADLSDVVDGISFGWDQKGCSSASLQITSAEFDDDFGIGQGDRVIISYTSGDPWWTGVVSGMGWTLTSGMSIECIGTRSKLEQSIPTGRFGTLVETGQPGDATATEAVNVLATLLADTYWYAITSIDEDGESWAGTPDAGQTQGTVGGVPYSEVVVATEEEVGLAWTAAQGATAYRIYRVTSPNAFTLANGCVYFETSENAFTDDGNSPGTLIDFPFSVEGDATSTTPTIAATDIRSVMRHLLDTYGDDEVSYLSSQIVDGDDEDLDDYDLTNSEATLSDVLDALMLLHGDGHWWVDEDRKIRYEDRDVSVAYTFKVYEGAASPTDTNVVVGLTRTKNHDGVTLVKVEGEEDYEDVDNERGDFQWATDRPGTLDNRVVSITNDHRVISIAVDKDSPKITPETRVFFDGYANLTAWLAAFPQLSWVYQAKDKLSDAFLARYFRAINEKIRDDEAPFDKVWGVFDGNRGRRPWFQHVPGPGITTTAAGGQLASNFMARTVPNPEQWSMELDLVDTLIKPGRGIIRLTSPGGERFDLEVHEVSYEFGETVTASITAGDKIVKPQEEDRAIRKAQHREASRRRYKNVWYPNKSA